MFWETEVAMIAVIFEVFPADGRKGDYLEHAAQLRSELECMDGFISVERWQSGCHADRTVDRNKRGALSCRNRQAAVRAALQIFSGCAEYRRGGETSEFRHTESEQTIVNLS